MPKFQNHHELYGDGKKDNEELLVKLRYGEHQIITLCRRYCKKQVSLKFVQLLEYLIAKWRLTDRVIDYDILSEQEKDGISENS